jgi:3-oxoacyl-[acyl-carrier protein] reductase
VNQPTDGAQRHIVVTGGSRGLGLTIVRQLAILGCRVTAINRTNSVQLNQIQNDFGDQVALVTCDLSDSSAVIEALASERLGLQQPFHGLVNNAAIAYDDLVTNLDQERLEASFRVNVFAPMELTKHVIKNMLLHRTPGSIVHMSSICAHTGFKGLSMYAASKGALEAFSKSIAREWGVKGIRSNCVVAGFMETEMSKSLNSEQRKKIGNRASLQRSTSVESVAATVLFLLSDASSSTTGQEMVVDCGTL